MFRPNRRTAFDLVEVLVGGSLVLLAVYLTYRTYRPLGTPGHVDGRGLFAPFLVAPTAALGGGVLAHMLPPRLSSERRRVGRYVAVVAASVLAVGSCVGYVLLFGDPALSGDPSTYRLWFVLGGVVGAVVAGISDLRSW